MTKDYAELRKKSKYRKTLATTPEVYELVEKNRGKKSRAQFVTESLLELLTPNLFNKKKK